MSGYIAKHLDKNNLHHAYLIEGEREEVVAELFSFVQSIDISTSGNPDFSYLSYDSLKMDDALSLRSMGDQKGFTAGKKIFVVSTNSLTLDAQQALLKMFEEPIENTHFFIIVPDANALIRTLVSRFYFIPAESSQNKKIDAEKFISMPLSARIAFLKDFLATEDEEEMVIDSVRAKSLRFLNDLESVLHKQFSKVVFDTNTDFFEQIFQVRKFLRQPGSSTKSLMESVALVIPSFSK